MLTQSQLRQVRETIETLSKIATASSSGTQTLIRQPVTAQTNNGPRAGTQKITATPLFPDPPDEPAATTPVTSQPIPTGTVGPLSGSISTSSLANAREGQ